MTGPWHIMLRVYYVEKLLNMILTALLVTSKLLIQVTYY